jgi:hypothetical protein
LICDEGGCLRWQEFQEPAQVWRELDCLHGYLHFTDLMQGGLPDRRRQFRARMGDHEAGDQALGLPR